MTQWDGLTSSNSLGESQRICVLGATNRIQDIDEAILRRLPKKFPVSLPSASQRRSIFSLTLKNTRLSPHFDIDTLVKVSAGMSGSDIKEACRDAAMLPVREYIREAKARGASMKGVKAEEVRGLHTDDFFGRKGGAFQMSRQPDVDEDDDAWEDSRAGPGTGTETDNEDHDPETSVPS
jgi:SpoVK/Ycf46/Vps4 family AAA+-type ATPase